MMTQNNPTPLPARGRTTACVVCGRMVETPTLIGAVACHNCDRASVWSVYYRSHGGEYRLDRAYVTEREANEARTRLANRAYQTYIEVSRG